MRVKAEKGIIKKETIPVDNKLKTDQGLLNAVEYLFTSFLYCLRNSSVSLANPYCL